MPERIVFPARGEVSLESFRLPDLTPDDVRVRTRYSLMSIGTETIILHQRYDPDTHFAEIFSFPQLKTGVQATGEIEAVGSNVTGLNVGDTVFMRMAHGSHQVIPAEACLSVPDGMDRKTACWCGLAKTAFRAAFAGSFQEGGSVLIIGAGPVGQMTVRWASAEGLSDIRVADLSAVRLEHARNGGATELLEGDIGDLASAGIEGPPLIIDTTGNPGVFRHALAAAPRFGKLILLGDTGYPARQCLTSDVMTKGLTVQAVHDSHDLGGWTQARIDRKFFSSVAEGRFNLDGLITHEFLPGQCAEAYALADQQREHTMGILYDWHQV